MEGNDAQCWVTSDHQHLSRSSRFEAASTLEDGSIYIESYTNLNNLHKNKLKLLLDQERGI